MIAVLHAFVHDGLVVWACVAACGLGYLGGEGGFGGDAGWALIVLSLPLVFPPVAIIWLAQGEGAGIAIATFAVLFAVLGAVLGRRHEEERSRRINRVGEILLEARREAGGDWWDEEPAWCDALWRELKIR